MRKLVAISVFIASVTITFFPFICDGRNLMQPLQASRDVQIKNLLEAGFEVSNRGYFSEAEKNWSEALDLLKRKFNTDKEQADYLLRMGKVLRKAGKEESAECKFQEAWVYYRNVADVPGQKKCIKALEAIDSPLLFSFNKNNIVTISRSAENRMELDNDGRLLPIRVEKLTSKKNEGLNYTTACYEVITLDEALSKYPILNDKIFAHKLVGNKAIKESNLVELWSRFKALKGKLNPKRQQNVIESVNLVENELYFWIKITMCDYILIQKGSGEIILTSGGVLKVLEEIVRGLAHQGIELSNCGWFDGFNISFSGVDLEGQSSFGLSWPEKKGFKRIKAGRWKGAYGTKDGRIFLPGYECFSVGSNYIKIKISQTIEMTLP